MSYKSACCDAIPNSETLDIWDNFEEGATRIPTVPLPDTIHMVPNGTPIAYGSCSSCDKSSLFYDSTKFLTVLEWQQYTHE